MKRILALTAIAITATAAWAGPASTLYKQTKGCIMTLLVKDENGAVIGNGTAFLVGRHGLAATAFHVIKGAKQASVRFCDGREAAVLGLVDGDESRDVAYIRVQCDNVKYLNMSEGLPEIGQETYVIGAPKGLDFSISEGIVNQVRMDDGIRVIQFSAPVSPGNSGSPLMDNSGNVFGVVSFQRTDGQNLNFAVPNSYLQDLKTTAKLRPLPKDADDDADGLPVAKWKPFDFAQTGLTIKLPSAPGTVTTDIDADLKALTEKYRTSKLNAHPADVGLTYFEFKSGKCPSVQSIVDEVVEQRKKVAIKLPDTKGENPRVMGFAPAGTDEGQAVVCGYVKEGQPIIETTAVLRKGDRLWMIVISYAADNSLGVEQLRTMLDSIEVK